MKKYMIIGAVLISGMIFAQNIEPKLEAVGQKVKATYYFESGKVQQEGFFKDGKLEGTWIAYDANGNKKSIGEYSNGQKTGKWFFWNNETLSEVDYSQSRIASVKNWKQDALVNRN
jgi:antitoxin component YwqK of YwqJK toxin-antitoxin module